MRNGGWEKEKEKPVLFRAADKCSCRSWGRAVSDLLVDANETIAVKNLETRVHVPEVIDSGRVSKRKGSESPA